VNSEGMPDRNQRDGPSQEKKLKQALSRVRNVSGLVHGEKKLSINKDSKDRSKGKKTSGAG